MIITQQMNLYAKQDKNEQNFSIDTKEMSHFISLLLISGYHRLPRENDYWLTSTSQETPIFTRTMSRKRSNQLSNFCMLLITKF